MSTYFIVGGSTGIGKEIVNKLSNQGHTVYATFNKTETNDFEQVKYVQLNVLDEDLNLDFLPESLDGVVYCPGSINLKPFHRFKEEDFIQDFKLQVIGATKVIKAVQKKLKTGSQGSIVLFSTIAVQQGFNFHSQVAISKGAIEGLTRSLAAEFAPSIRVNAIAPSLTDTPLAVKLLNTEQKRTANAERNPLKKIGEAKDVAEAALFLLSDQSSWISGQIIHVDGGMSVIK